MPKLATSGRAELQGRYESVASCRETDLVKANLLKGRNDSFIVLGPLANKLPRDVRHIFGVYWDGEMKGDNSN